MSPIRRPRPYRSGLTALGLACLLVLGGCFSWSGGGYSSYGARLGAFSAETSGLESRTLTARFTATPGETVRILNFAGEVDLVMGQGTEVVVEATIYAEGRDAAQTRRLLDGAAWVSFTGRHGRTYRRLSFGDERTSIHYPALTNGRVVTTVAGRRYTIASAKSASTPTLFANLTIRVPASAPFVVRNIAGHVSGGSLGGDLVVKTGVGNVRIEAFAGDLTADTGSGNITLGSVVGKLLADTGSGNVQIERLSGRANLDTGSGNIVVAQVDAEKVVADTGSGDVEIRNGSVGEINADTGSGNISVIGVEFESFRGDTGSGNIHITSGLVNAYRLIADTGSGNVAIVAGPDASFHLQTDLGSGRVYVGFDDARLEMDGREVVGAFRGDGKTRIHVDTGSGNCTIKPRES